MKFDYDAAKDRRANAKAFVRRAGYADGGIAFPATQFKTSQSSAAPFSRAREASAAASADTAAQSDGSLTQRDK